MNKGFIARMRTTRLFRKGVQCVEKNEFEQALEYFEGVIEEDPHDAPALNNVGFCNLRLGRYDAAIAAYAEASELDPYDPQYACDLGSVYLKLNRLDEALEAFNRASRIDPDHQPAMLGQAEAHYRLGKHEDAVRIHQQIIDQDPDCAEAYYGLGLVFLSRREYASAVDALNQTIRLSPDEVTAYEGLARAYEALGRDTDAVAAWEEAARLQPFSAQARCLLGKAYVRLGEWRKAFNAFQQAVRLDPDLSEAQEGLAEAHIHVKPEEKETPETRRAELHVLEPDDAPPFDDPLDEAPVATPPEPKPQKLEANDADIDPLQWPFDEPDEAPKNNADVEPAVSTMEGVESEELNDEPPQEEADIEDTTPFEMPEEETTETEMPTAPDVEELIDEGRSQYLEGNYEQALALWEQAAAIDPEDPAIHNNRAAALVELGQLDAAIDACKQALDIDAGYAVAYATLCEIYAQQDDRSALEQTLSKLQDLDPDLAGEITEQLEL